MQADLLTLQALFVASGILVIWFFWRAKPWRQRHGPARGQRRKGRGPSEKPVAKEPKA